MLSKCANPECSAVFRYLHQGKLYRAELGNGANAAYAPEASDFSEKPARRIEYFWLCERCVSRVTLTYKKGVGVSVQPRARAAKVSL